uniref:Uncharacterized protein n=1 Tax=Vespula pensylvanica TaxID=30213 RepID=A0A834P334_VESPE|nr:hypothetical protein H0235_008323 [Vespula pensylvanica]
MDISVENFANDTEKAVPLSKNYRYTVEYLAAKCNVCELLLLQQLNILRGKQISFCIAIWRKREKIFATGYIMFLITIRNKNNESIIIMEKQNLARLITYRIMCKPIFFMK